MKHKNIYAHTKNTCSSPSAHNRPRFSEWSIACCKKQLSVLVDGNPGPSFHYMGLFLEDDAKVMTKNSSTIAGMLMTQWWDESGEAGPKRRPRSKFEEASPSLQTLTIANGACKILDFISAQ